MTIRQFLVATQDAPAGHRADAAAALARIYLEGDLAPEAAAKAKSQLLALLDDPSASVRRSLAEACAASPRTPRPLVVALTADHPDIACLVLARSPVLIDADLVDCAAVGCERMRSAIAGRASVSKPVAAALAEVAGVEALTVLAENVHASVGTAAFLRMIERHGHDTELREALLRRDEVEIEVKQTIAARAAAWLAQYSQASGWVSPERGERMVREAREAVTLSLGDEAGEVGLARLVTHLRKKGELNAGLILRAILTLRVPFAEAAFADLAGLSRARVAGLMFEPMAAGFVALHHKAGLPPVLLPVIQASLVAWREAATASSALSGVPLARHMIERAIAVCEKMPFAEGRALMALLARFQAEAAREEARDVAQAAIDQEPDGVLLLGQAERTTRPEPLALCPPDRVAVSAPRAVVEGDRTAFPVEAVLDELPAAIVASYRTMHERKREAQTGAVLDELGGALVARFLAERDVSAMQAAAPAAELIEVRPKAARPREIALALAASMIPIVTERDRVRLAA